MYQTNVTHLGISVSLVLCRSINDGLGITLYTALEEGFAALTGPDAVVVSRGVVAAHCAVPDLLH